MTTAFTTLGMFIIDEIHYEKNQNKPPVYDIMGGAGTYAVLGCRLFAGLEAWRYNGDEKEEKATGYKSHDIKWIVDAGKDFPTSLENEINSWQTGVILRRDGSRLTTRGWNGYGAHEARDFRYLTEKKRLTVEDLVEEGLADTRAIHLVCSPDRLITECKKLELEKKESRQQPIVIWEPVPGLTAPQYMDTCIEALQWTNVFSPNVLEAAQFLGETQEPTTREEVTRVALAFLRHMPAAAPGDNVASCNVRAVILRRGALGCAVFSQEPFTGRSFSSTDQNKIPQHYYAAWLPAYHVKGRPDYCVEDPTGAGNAFLGGVAGGLLAAAAATKTQPGSGGKDDKPPSTMGLYEAAIYGTVAAGAVVEQVGVPKVTKTTDDPDEDLWNGVSVRDRIRRYTRDVLSKPFSG